MTGVYSIAESNIAAYFNFFRDNFPKETVTPKMHILEYHVVPWIKQWRVGLGFHGEQGGESVHSRFNTIKRAIRGIKGELAILQAILKRHWLQTSPVISSK